MEVVCIWRNDREEWDAKRHNCQGGFSGTSSGGRVLLGEAILVGQYIQHFRLLAPLQACHPSLHLHLKILLVLH